MDIFWAAITTPPPLNTPQRSDELFRGKKFRKTANFTIWRHFLLRSQAFWARSCSFSCGQFLPGFQESVARLKTSSQVSRTSTRNYSSGTTGFFCWVSSSVELEGSFGLVSSPTQWVELIEWWNLTSFECVLDIESVNVIFFHTMKEKAAAVIKRVLSLLHWKGAITMCKQYYRKRQAPWFQELMWHSCRICIMCPLGTSEF